MSRTLTDPSILISQAANAVVIDKDCVAVKLLASVTLNTTEVELTATVGVPEITPLELSVSPAGNVPEAIVQV